MKTPSSWWAFRNLLTFRSHARWYAGFPTSATALDGWERLTSAFPAESASSQPFFFACAYGTPQLQGLQTTVPAK